MKKLLLLLALVGMVAYGCTDSSTDDDNNPPTEQPGPVGDEDLSFTNNTNTAPTISHEGGTAKISFMAALSWSVSVYADWLSVSQDEGEAGNGSFVITAEPNTTAKERKGVVAIKLSNHKSYEITVKQSFNADSDDIEFINNTNTAPHMEAGGGTVNIQFIAKTDWTVTCYADWLSTTRTSGSKGENSFFITATSNPNDKERTGVVAIKSTNGKSYEVTVTQDLRAGILQLVCAANEILYITKYNTQITLGKSSGFGGNLISHTYDAEKGYGSIRFDNDVTYIPAEAFANCTTMTTIYLPDGVEDIAVPKMWRDNSNMMQTRYGAFSGCTALEYIVSNKSDSNNKCVVINGRLVAVAYDKKIVLPDTVKELSYCFRDHGRILEEIVVSEGVKTIPEYTFRDCYYIISITLPSTVSKIGGYAFEDTYVTNIYVKAKTPPVLEQSALSGLYSSTTIYVPTASLQAYKAAGWGGSFGLVGYNF